MNRHGRNGWNEVWCVELAARSTAGQFGALCSRPMSYSAALDEVRMRHRNGQRARMIESPYSEPPPRPWRPFRGNPPSWALSAPAASVQPAGPLFREVAP